MAKNELWFYSGVRCARDGRYTCYCPTPQKKRTVLLKGASITLALANGVALAGGNTFTPWNIRQKEIRVEYGQNTGGGDALSARNFMNSNYLIVHDMATGAYYCYYIDYIDTVQQLKDYSDNAPLNLEAIGTHVVYRVGITLDYWQTFFFKMQTKLSTNDSRPVYCTPTSTNSDTINEVVMPAFDFMNVVRSNMKNIISDNNWMAQFPKVEDTIMSNQQTNTVICDLLSFAIPNADNNLTEKNSRGYGEYVIALQLELVRDRVDGTKRETLFVWTYDGFNKSYDNADIPLSSKYILQVITRANILSISQGDFMPAAAEKNFTAPDGTSEYYNFGATNKIKYNVVNAWLLPKPIVYACVPENYRNSIGVFGTITPLNTELTTPVFPFPTFNMLKTKYTGAAAANKQISFTNAYQGITITADTLEQFFTALVTPDGGNGTVKHEVIKACAFIGNNNKQIKLAAEINDVKQIGSYFVCPIFECVNLKVYIYCDGLTLNYVIKSQYQEINIIDDCKIPLRNVVDNEEIARAKEREEAQKQNDILSLMTSGVGFGVSLFTGNIPGAVMSGAQLAAQTAKFGNAQNLTTDYEKLKNSSTTPATIDAILKGSILITLPTQTDGGTGSKVTLPSFSINWVNKFTEIGATVNVQINNIHENLTSDFAYRLEDLFEPQTANTGYIECGLLLVGIAAEAAEVLEKRFREGVNFYYV